MVSSFILSSNQVTVAGGLSSDFPVALPPGNQPDQSSFFQFFIRRVEFEVIADILPGNQPDQSSFFQFFIRRVEFEVIADILPGKVFQYTGRFSHDVDGRNHDED